MLLDSISEEELTDFDALDEIDSGLEDLDLTEIVPNVTEAGVDLLEQEIEELESFVSDLRQIDRDPKVDQLIEDLNQLDREGHNRIIIFTQYTDTMDFIRNSLVSIHGETVATYSGRGGEMYDADEESWRTVGKERVKREFFTDKGQVDILVCTDSASEGLNLQECGALINYDLPWNPMRVEQRIGRIDRIGQRYDEVEILNYSYKDTVETDIYERLDDRIDLFENVVGEMQPVLSGVSKQIRTATLEKERDESHEAVAAADREFSEQIENQEQSDRVDVGESLETVEPLVAQDVIDEARLDAWQSYIHPDIGATREDNYRYQAPYRTASLEAILVENETLANAGVEFTSIADLDIDITDSEYDGEFGYEKTTYRLKWNGMELPEPDGEQTFAQFIAPSDDAVAVTFSSDCADEFPSIHHFAPGNPLLHELIEILRETTDEPGRLVRQAKFRETATERPTVCGWMRNENLGRVGRDGEVVEDLDVDVIDSWFAEFQDNHERTTSR